MKVTITGGSGFLGEKLIERLKGNITIVSRNEGEAVKIKEKFPEVKIITGDIADEWVAKKAIKGADEVYHLAAYKHVGLAESNAYQCISSNVLGSIQILRAVQEYKPKLLVGISTDKAAQVNGVYGATKFLMERLFQEAEKLNPETKYRIVRYGNVLYSTGSVLCKWKERIKKGEEVTITDGKMTRFFWTRDQAIDHIFECINKSHDSTPYIPKMKAMALHSLLAAMYGKYGIGEQRIKTIGAQPGDNFHETIDGHIFSNEVEQYTIEEIKKLI
jgi:FlaA1/EpsC-like NDP-sugar epimerase